MNFRAALNRSLVIGFVALVASVGGLAVNADQFYRSYLIGYLYVVSIPLGCLALLMLHHLVGGDWGVVIRRLLEAGTRTFPVVLVFLLPVIISMQRLYIWARADVVAKDAILQHKAVYLNAPGFIGRAAFYFAVWIALSHFLNHFSMRQEARPEGEGKTKLQQMSGIGILLFGLTVTFASVDWGMSIDPHWYSTIYGVQFMVSSALTGMALVIVMLHKLGHGSPLEYIVRPSHLHDLGTLMFAFLMLWAYVSFSQYLIIWSGNLPEEIPFYLHRLHGSWGIIAAILVAFHFAVPFLLLLSKQIKRRGEVLAKIAFAMLALRLLDLIWLIAPSFHVDEIHIHWLDISVPTALASFWMAAFFWQLGKRPLVPVEVETLSEANHGGGH